MTDLQQDPELLESDGGTGDPIVYDTDVIANTPFDPEQFELPDDYEYEGDENVED